MGMREKGSTVNNNNKKGKTMDNQIKTFLYNNLGMHRNNMSHDYGNEKPENKKRSGVTTWGVHVYRDGGFL